MKQFVITITRQFGSMGRPIAQLMAESLGINYYDRDIVETTAKKMGLPISTVSNEEENIKLPLFNMKFPLGIGSTEIQDEIFKVEQNIIQEIADRESCIIVGRCSDYILRNQKNSTHIYIYASYESRLENCIEKLYIPKNKASAMISDIDKAREIYHKRYAKYAPDDIQFKDIMISSNLLGIEGTAEALVNIIKNKYS